VSAARWAAVQGLGTAMARQHISMFRQSAREGLCAPGLRSDPPERDGGDRAPPRWEVLAHAKHVRLAATPQPARRRHPTTGAAERLRPPLSQLRSKGGGEAT